MNGGLIRVALTQILAQALMLFRNILIGRMIGPEQYGAAIAMMVTISALEMFSDVGIESFVVRGVRGALPRYQSTLHLLSVGRGVLMAALLLIFGPTLAVLFSAPEAAQFFQALAIYPVVRGFAHLDTKRYQRSFLYTADQILFAFCQLLSLAVALALIIAGVRTYAVMFFALIAQAAGYTIMSHSLANRRYRLSFDTRALHELLAFGLPLTIAGFVGFFGMNLDRIVVGHLFGVNILGRYAAALSIMLAAAMLMQKISSVFFLPRLAGHQRDRAAQWRLALWFNIFAATALMLPLCVAGGYIVELLFGPSFVLGWLTYSLLALVGALRLVRGAFVTRATGIGETRQVMIASTITALGVALGAAVAALSMNIDSFIIMLAIGEFIAVAFMIFRPARMGTGQNEPLQSKS